MKSLATFPFLLLLICVSFIACKNPAGGKTVSAETDAAQTDIYELAKQTIRDNDIAKFDSLLEYIPVIDSLTPEKNTDVTYTLLGYAIKNNNYAFTEKLIDAKANMGKAYESLYYSRDALYLSLECKSDSIIKLLLEKGANPNERYDENGTTILLLSCSDREYNYISQLLITHGAYINGVAENDSSWVDIPSVYPLVAAIQNSNFEMVEYLMEKGCRLSFGEVSAIDIAEKEGHTELAGFIRQYLLDNYQLNVDESWYGQYEYSNDVEEEDWRNAHSFMITIRPDTCIFEGEGYQLYFRDLCTVETERQDTIELYYYYTLDGSERNRRDPYIGILFRKDGKYYLNSLALADEAVNGTDVEVEKVE